MGLEHSSVELGADQKHVQDETELPNREEDCRRGVLDYSGDITGLHRFSRWEERMLENWGDETKEGRAQNEAHDHLRDDLRLPHRAKEDANKSAGDENDG
jgi:hypothetical protein